MSKNITKLEEREKLACEGLITEEELVSVLKNMKNNKTPGSDGLPPEFYKIFWKETKVYLLRSINAAYHSKELSITQKQGVITCLPKGNKTRTYYKLATYIPTKHELQIIIW